MSWIVAAEGVSLSDLKQVVADRDLVKGTKIRAEINVASGFGWLFDAPGAELAFLPFIPSGVDLIDVYGEGNKGIVDMEADPIGLVALLTFIKANWLAIAIAGILLTTIILSIKLLIQVEATIEDYLPWIIGGLFVFGAIYLLEGRRKVHVRSRKKN